MQKMHIPFFNIYKVQLHNEQSFFLKVFSNSIDLLRTANSQPNNPIKRVFKLKPVNLKASKSNVNRSFFVFSL